MSDTSIAVITCGPFYTKDGTGNRVPDGSDIPRMKGRSQFKIRREIAALERVMEYLAETPCSFWACAGATRPRHMITCQKCWAMRELGAVIETMKREAQPKAQSVPGQTTRR